MSGRPVPKLMWVTDSKRASRPVVEIARLVAAEGVDLIHVREKTLSRSELRSLVAEVVDAVGDTARIVVNTDAEIAKELGTGVHFPEEVRDDADLTAFPQVGRSVHSPDSAAISTKATYHVAGHIFETGSKAGRPPIGIEGLASIVRATTLPVLAIGGITPERVAGVLEAGAHGIAVMSGIGSANDPSAAAVAYRDALDRARASLPWSTSMALALTVNGKPVELDAPMTIQEFLDLRKLHRNMVVVEHNGVILKRPQFTEVTLQSGDLLEVVHFVGGG